MIGKNEHNQIAHVDLPSKELFHQNFVEGRRPAIISGAMKGWKALGLWNAVYLKTVIGIAEVRVEVSQTNYFPSHLGQDPVNIKRNIKQMRFDEYADVVSTGNKITDKYYLSDGTLIDRCPILAEDIEYPAFLDDRLRINKSFWFSSADTITPLHYDLVYNLFTQICGRKKFTLFAPDQLSFLYPCPIYTRVSQFSRVDIERPNFIRFPKFQDAEPIEFTLAPGEMLFLPPFWWHQVHSLDEAASVSFWWNMSWTEYLARPALRLTYPVLAELIRGFRGH